MCLDFDSNAGCNSNPPQSSEHMEYTAYEYAALGTWCTNNYPYERIMGRVKVSTTRVITSINHPIKGKLLIYYYYLHQE